MTLTCLMFVCFLLIIFSLKQVKVDAADNFILLPEPFSTETPKTPHTSPATSPTQPLTLSGYKCNICKALVSHLDSELHKPVPDRLIDQTVIAVCELLHKQCDNPQACHEMCVGLVSEHSDEVIEILTETVLAPEHVCCKMHLCPAPAPVPHPEPSKPVVPSVVTDWTGQPHYDNWYDKSLNGRFIQLSDIHLDVEYTVNSSTVCGEPLCCKAKYGAGSAGKWGSYNCDTNEELFVSLLKYIANLPSQQQPDFILYTGDSPPHDIWQQSKQKNINTIQRIFQLIKQHLPNTQILSTLGNHASFPVNQYRDPEHDEWLFDAVATQWREWLPQQALTTLRYGGFYATLINPKLRLYIVSLNSNYYINENFWRMTSDYDVSWQFVWLRDVLKQIQSIDGRVIVIAHASPLHWRQHFADEFYTSIQPFNGMILNHFYGHTHYQEVIVLPAEKVAYVGGSVTPFTQLNPGFVVYEYDVNLRNDSWIEDYQQHWIDLEAWNAAAAYVVDWDKDELSAKSCFHLPSLSAQHWSELANSFTSSAAAQLFTAYTTAMYRGRTPAQVNPHDIACAMLGSSEDAYKQCMQQHGQSKVKRTTVCD